MNIKNTVGKVRDFTLKRLIEFIGILILIFAILVFLALISYSPNDPNFIFENDPLFETVILYDTEGNVINVNSWLECAHYVTGGWSLSIDTFINEERYLFLSHHQL